MLQGPDKIQKKTVEKNLALILLAAGYSSRMKLFKPLLPFGPSTVIEISIDAFLRAGIKNIIVVIGHKADKLKSVLNKKGIQWVYNEQYTEGMFSSVIAGVRTLPDNTTGFFLLPSDMPLIKTETIEAMTKAYAEKNPKIAYPVFSNRRGHPPLISSELLPEILEHDGTGGLNYVLAKYKSNALHIEVEDEGIHLDMDTYEEYLDLYHKIESRKFTATGAV